ncbi:hypothetical protein DPMN_075955 [Dreissena polymorpha]|uniref:Uncharacterized protein n=1 Tax=Dreissena polymorpha TaxID=45954 RepID=A0A9D3YLD8_DREPO|nr:hypothetical protein DPMN_075955 [Dreissena polymorpha]
MFIQYKPNLSGMMSTNQCHMHQERRLNLICVAKKETRTTKREIVRTSRYTNQQSDEGTGVIRYREALEDR